MGRSPQVLGYSEHPSASLFFQLGYVEGQKLVIESRMKKIRDAYLFTDSQCPQIQRSFVQRRIQDLGNENWKERIKGIVFLALGCITIIGIFFILAARGDHFHYTNIENELVELIKKNEKLILKEAEIRERLKPISRQQTLRLSSGDSGSISTISTLSDNTKNFKEVDRLLIEGVEQKKVNKAVPSSTLSYYDSNTDKIEDLLEVLKENSLSNLKKGITVYPYEELRQMMNGFLLRWVRKESVEIWYPDDKDRQNLGKYTVLEINKGKVDPSTRELSPDDIQKLKTYIQNLENKGFKVRTLLKWFKK